jgi:hypothetical protein
MAEVIWFGTKDLMQWVLAPKQNMDSSRVGHSSTSSYLNGGAHVRRSWSGHKEYTLAWNLATRDEIRPIQDYADGIFGQGSIYWLNPFTADVNILPQYWASPFQNTLDGPVFARKGKRPVATSTAQNYYRYPTTSAQYTVVDTLVQPKIWLPLPPGYTMWFGVHGSAGSGGLVTATPTLANGDDGNTYTLPFLSTNTSQRVSTSFDSSTTSTGGGYGELTYGDAGYGDGPYGGGTFGSGGGGSTTLDYIGVTLSFGGSGTMVLSGLVAQVLPTGETPATGMFMSGQGHSGCSFDTLPSLTEYSVGVDKIGLAAKLVETEAWV